MLSANGRKITGVEYMVSQKQIEANRQNAQLSTGPADTAKTRLNATKHGLAANLPISKQEKEKLDGFLTKLREQFNVQTLIGEYLIARIAVGMLRLERVPEYEEHNRKYAEYQRNAPSAFTPEFEKEEEALFKHLGIAKTEPFKEHLVFDIDDEKLYRYETAAENKVYKALEKIYELKKNGFVL